MFQLFGSTLQRCGWVGYYKGYCPRSSSLLNNGKPYGVIYQWYRHLIHITKVLKQLKGLWIPKVTLRGMRGHRNSAAQAFNLDTLSSSSFIVACEAPLSSSVSISRKSVCVMPKSLWNKVWRGARRWRSITWTIALSIKTFRAICDKDC